MKNSVMANPLFIVIILLLGLIIILAVFRTASPFLTLGFGINARIGDLKGSFEIEAFDNDNQPVFVMFYAEWCGHCKKTMPEFNSLIEGYKGNIKIIMIDSEASENTELIKSQNIKGFPTIRYYPSGFLGESQEYNGNRTANDFIEYLNSM
jgi:thiol-disulfide isomerase/thioredoxin